MLENCLCEVILEIDQEDPEIELLIDGEVIDGDQLEEYAGATSVRPLAWQSTTLATGGKKVANDITVEEIPYYSVSNPFGGETVYIGD